MIFVFGNSFCPMITWRQPYNQRFKLLKSMKTLAFTYFGEIFDLAYQTCGRKLLLISLITHDKFNICTDSCNSAHFLKCGGKLHVYNKIICYNFKSHHKSMSIFTLVVLFITQEKVMQMRSSGLGS